LVGGKNGKIKNIKIAGYNYYFYLFGCNNNLFVSNAEYIGKIIKLSFGNRKQVSLFHAG
jgi:hypothetical protein